MYHSVSDFLLCYLSEKAVSDRTVYTTFILIFSQQAAVQSLTSGGRYLRIIFCKKGFLRIELMDGRSLGDILNNWEINILRS